MLCILDCGRDLGVFREHRCSYSHGKKWKKIKRIKEIIYFSEKLILLLCFPEGVKLAAIFSKKKAAKDTSAPITISEDSNDGAPPKPMDPAKKAFLLSGVPDTLKKPERPCEVVVYGTSAPLPVVSHVLQREIRDEGVPGLDVWNLSRPALALREAVQTDIQVAKKMEKGEVTQCQDIAQVRTMDKVFVRPNILINYTCQLC